MARASRKRATLLGRGVALRRAVATGGAANAALTATGVKLGDDVISVWELVAGVPTTDRTATTTVTANDVVKCSASTAGNVLDIWVQGRP
jgi:hypothetical protein